MQSQQHTKTIGNTRGNKLLILYILFVVLVLAFLYKVFITIVSDRRIPAKTAVIHDRSLRGDIISQDGYTVSSSYKLYKAIIHADSIKPDKVELFVTLFGIYSGMGQNEIRKKLYDKNGRLHNGNVTLSYDIDARRAIQLKSLALKMRKLNVFQSIKNRQGIDVVYGLDIIESGEARRFPLVDCLTPVIGYVRKKSDERYTSPIGAKGLERYAEKHITSMKNGYFQGERDVIGSVIRNGSSIVNDRADGLELHLNIPLGLQRRVEMILDQMKEETGAEEIIAAVMESKTGRILAIGSSERFDPSVITKDDVEALNPKFAEYPYEPGSVLKPFTLAIALDHGRVTPDKWFNTYNGTLRIGKNRIITDDDKFASLTVTDIIVHSSNVGVSQISWTLNGMEFRKGLLDFGLSRPSGLDLSRDLPGMVKSQTLLNNQMHRANQSYGYGMHATFAQLLKAYSAFNNDGKAMTPRIIDYFKDTRNNRIYRIDPPAPDLQAVSKKTADQIHSILVQVVQRGTGVAGQIEGLEVGGKTGTAHIATSAGYSKLFHSSFYGFANDELGHKYTIGVLVIKARKPYKYFAAQSAVPTFKKIANAMIELDYLKPKIASKELIVQNEETEISEPRKISAKEHTPSGSPKPTTKPRKPKPKLTAAADKPKPPSTVSKPAQAKSQNKKQPELFNDLDMF